MDPWIVSRVCQMMFAPRDNNSGSTAWYLMRVICMRSPSGHASVVGNGGCCAGRLLFIVNGCFEAADTFSDSFPEFRKLFRSEDQQGNSDDYQQMHGLKQSFKHI